MVVGVSRWSRIVEGKCMMLPQEDFWMKLDLHMEAVVSDECLPRQSKDYERVVETSLVVVVLARLVS